MKNVKKIVMVQMSTVVLSLLISHVAMADCPADLNDDGNVGFADLTGVLAAWGPCTGLCEADFNGDENVGFSDLTTVLAAWGPCPIEECPYSCVEVDLFCAFSQGTVHADLPCSDGGVCCEVPQLDPCPYTCDRDLFVCMADGGNYLQEYQCSNGADCCQLP